MRLHFDLVLLCLLCACGLPPAEEEAPGNGALEAPLCAAPAYTQPLPVFGNSGPCQVDRSSPEPSQWVTTPSPGPVGAPGSIQYGIADPDDPTKRWDVYANLTYAVRGGRALQGDLWIPHGPRTVKPGILVGIHGGGWKECNRRRDAVHDFIRRVARESGAAFFNIEYRLSQEGGMFPENLRDVKCALQFVTAKARRYALPVDPDRLGVLGESAGAHLSAMLALTQHRDDLDPGCTSDGMPVPRPKVVAAWAFSPVADLPSLAFSTSAAADAPRLYTNNACAPGVSVDASACTCGVANRCVDASPLQHACGLSFAAGTRLTLIHAPRTTSGAEYDALIPLEQPFRLFAAVSAFTPERAALWVPDEAAVRAWGCDADGDVPDSAHGFSPCLTMPLAPRLLTSIHEVLGGS
ncbi:alpha/beta hydrolase [Pyxidicoccus sp. 3LFB2]